MADQSKPGVVVAAMEGLVVVRDGKEPHRAVLIFSPLEWSAFLVVVRAGGGDPFAPLGPGGPPASP